MTPQELKASILQLAIQGKLVEQRPEEGTGGELLEKILATKNTKDTKKNSRAETRIPQPKAVREADALAGVRRGEGSSALTSKNISAAPASPREEIPDSEKPFDIPESWVWVRLGEVVSNHGQKKPTGDFSYIDIGSIDNKNQRLSNDETIVHAENASPRARKIVQKGDVIYATVRPYLHNVCVIDREFTREPIASTGFAVMACDDCLDNKYLFYFLLSPDFDRYANSSENAKGVAYPAISDKRLYNALIPLPPLAEQKRIVAKIEELLPYIDRYEKAWSKLEDFNKRFPVAMQKSLLQLAIQGKLVDQRPEEGTGEELYRQIQSEKQLLIKSGKIKKEKPLPEISPDEIPFDIPESWKWVRIGMIFNLQAGKTISSAEIYQEASSEHVYRCYGGNGCRGYVAGYNRSGHFALIGRQGALCGNINYAEGDFYATEHAVVVEQFGGTSVAWCGYFLKALNLNQYATATAQPGLAVTNINQVLIPLPPLAEQKRIAAKLEELLPLCERLK